MIFRFRLSKGSLLLLHLAAAGHVWRDDNGRWVATTLHTKRNVDLRIGKLISLGVLRATYEDSFLTLTDLGLAYLREHPMDDALQATMIR